MIARPHLRGGVLAGYAVGVACALSPNQLPRAVAVQLAVCLLFGAIGAVAGWAVVRQREPSDGGGRLAMYLLAAALVFFRLVGNTRDENAVMVFDAIGLSVYCVLGTRIALLAGLSPVAAAVLGLVTAVGGGILRDVVAGEPPAVFGGRGWYALPAILGAGTTAALGQAEVLNPLTSAAVMVLVLVLRVVSLRREWLAPGAEISGETQRQRLDPHDEPPVPDIRDRKGRDGPPADPGEDGPPANEETPGADEDVTPRGTPG